MASPKAPNSELTVDELLGLLKKTSLPTVIVEGDDDMIVYRRLENRLAHLGVSILPAGGRTKVLDLFRRRTEVHTSVKLAFLVDQDTWVNTGVPAEFVSPTLLSTWGYSIENDIFADGELCNLLIGPEAMRFDRDLVQFVEWYALALSRHLRGTAASLSLHPDHVLNPDQRAGLLALEPNEAYPASLRDQIARDFGRLLRGKSLFALLIRNANSRSGLPKHTDKALLEMVAMRPGPKLDAMRRAVEAIFT